MTQAALTDATATTRPAGNNGHGRFATVKPWRWWWVAPWIAAIALAAALDIPVADWMNQHVAATIKASAWHNVFKAPGNFFFTLVVALLLSAFHPMKWRAGAFLAAAGLLSGSNGLVKWIVGRERPFTGKAAFDLHPFRDGIFGLFQEKNLCFPSGHAALAFATAAALAVLLPRWRAAFYFGAALVAAERVMETAHYLSDTVAGAAFALLLVYGLHRLAVRIPAQGSARLDGGGVIP